MLELLVYLLCGGILASGLLAVRLKSLLAALVSAGLASLFAAVCYLLLGAPDVGMPDAFTRIQAGTKASTLGNTLVLVGIAFYHPDWSLKLLIVIYFVLMTNPIASHALARAALAIQGRGALSPAAEAIGQDDERSEV